MSSVSKYTPSERSALVRKVTELREHGLSVRVATKKVGVSVSNYSNWYSKERRGGVLIPLATPTPQKIVIEKEDSGGPTKLVCLIGDANAIGEAIRQWL